MTRPDWSLWLAVLCLAAFVVLAAWSLSPLAVLLAVEALVIVAAFFGMLRLRRAADRAWRFHQIVQRLQRRHSVRITFEVDTARFEAAMKRVARAAAEAARALTRIGGAS